MLKKIISLSIIICMILSLYISPAHATGTDELILDEQYLLDSTTPTATMTYTPQTSGFYMMTLTPVITSYASWSDTIHSTVALYYDSDSVADCLFYGANNKSGILSDVTYYYYLNANQSYQFNVSRICISGYTINSNNFSLSYYPGYYRYKGELGVGSTGSIESGIMEYLVFTPQISGTIFLDMTSADYNAYNKFSFYDTYAHKYYTPLENHLTAEVTAGEKCLLLLGNRTYDFNLQYINYDSIPVPQINRESGITRPFRAELSSPIHSDIYYKLSGVGDYQLYTKPFVVDNDCIVCAYAVTDGVMSEKVFFNYEMDYSPVSAPQITVVSETASDSTLSFSAEDGIIFYRDIHDSDSHLFYEYEAGTTITVQDGVEAYALCGNTKSESAFYINNKSKEAVVDEYAPSFTVTPVIGGKKVVASVPADFALGTTYTEEGYVDDHPLSMCMKPGYVHDSTWQYYETMTYVKVSNSCNGQGDSFSYYDKNDLREGITVTEDTAFLAEIIEDHYVEDGYWETEGLMHHRYMHEGGGRAYSFEREDTALLVSVPKATAPTIKSSKGTATIITDDGLTAYYSVNGGDFSEYTDSFTVTSGDIIKAYSKGLGVSDSDIVTRTASFFPGTTGITMQPEITGEFSGTPTVAKSTIDNISLSYTSNMQMNNLMLIVAAYDTETQAIAAAAKKDISLAYGDNLFEDISIELSSSFEHLYLKAFIWDANTLKPVCADRLTILN